MKWIFSIACLIYLAALSDSFCFTEDDCDEDECCVASSTYDLLKDGYCEKLSRRGRACNQPDAKLDYYGGKYVHSCPCRAGLECVPKGLKPNVTDPVKIRQKLRCRSPLTTVNPEEVTEEITTTPEQTTIGYIS